jgi:hypothetical protein
MDPPIHGSGAIGRIDWRLVLLRADDIKTSGSETGDLGSDALQEFSRPRAPATIPMADA